MASQPKMRNGKHNYRDNYAIQRLDKLDSFLALALQLVSCLAQWLEHFISNRGVVSSGLPISILFVSICQIKSICFYGLKSLGWIYTFLK